jgi:hypothetical protein
MVSKEMAIIKTAARLKLFSVSVQDIPYQNPPQLQPRAANGQTS